MRNRRRFSLAAVRANRGRLFKLGYGAGGHNGAMAGHLGLTTRDYDGIGIPKLQANLNLSNCGCGRAGGVAGE